MYYFRDSYFDQQIAYGIASGARRRRTRPISTPKRAWNTVSQLMLSLTCLFVTFVLAYAVIDVLGLEHLLPLAELQGLIENAEVLKPLAVHL